MPSAAAGPGRPTLPLRELLLEMPHHHDTEGLPRLAVRRLAELPETALARIWLLRPGDICDVCPMRTQCPDQTRCLHLVASAGTSTHSPEADWSRIDDEFRRFPVGSATLGKVGTVAESGAPVVVPDVADENRWIVRPAWAAAEGIRGFAGQPLLFAGETLGVLGVFTRRVLDEDWVSWLRLIADHLAGAIVNARAFEEIDCLRSQLELENAYLKEEVDQAQAFGEIVGRSPSLEGAVRQVDLVAPTDASVLIEGESGTGKELVAREIHRRSGRADRPLIKVNCASIPRELYESEFFGHVKGAFTGAVRDRPGRFEAADGGTIFLDEVGEIPLELQAKLLRVLQEGEYERIGSDVTHATDVRVLAATNRHLLDEVNAGRFRSDLYYRLNVFPIHVPPLRERREDIGPLATHFVREAAVRLDTREPRLTRADVRALERYDWPGNVRELRNVIERAVITATGGRLRLDHLVPATGGGRADAPPPGAEAEVLTEDEMLALQRENIRRALQRAGGRVYGDGGAAELLGLKPTTLRSRIRKFGIDP